MKKNLVPLLGIAFVVAILSTAIFYGLIASKIAGSAHANSGPANPPVAAQHAGEFSVRPGFRAVSVQVADSSGVLEMLHPGSRVDIQAVYSKSGSPHEVELRTVLQNIEVLKVSAEPMASPGRAALPVVTFLTTPPDADVLALADSGARLRLALRHPEDRGSLERGVMDIGSLMRPRIQPSRALRSAPGGISQLPSVRAASGAPGAIQ